jgi:hypothetical protein
MVSQIENDVSISISTIIAATAKNAKRRSFQNVLVTCRSKTSLPPYNTVRFLKMHYVIWYYTAHMHQSTVYMKKGC